MTTAPSHSPDANTTVLPLPLGNSSPPVENVGSLANDPPGETTIRIRLTSSAAGGGGGGVNSKRAAMVWLPSTLWKV